MAIGIGLPIAEEPSLITGALIPKLENHRPAARKHPCQNPGLREFPPRSLQPCLSAGKKHKENHGGVLPGFIQSP